MTTPNEELLARAKRLRNELDDSNARLDRQCVTAMYEMEQALQSQAERIKELELDLDVQAGSIEAVQAANSRLAAERDTLRAELAQGVEASMINLPEPVELNPAANSVMGHSDATLKQAVRDALDAQDVTGLVDCLSELCDIVEGVVEDKSSVGSLIDSFTTQPARTTLSKYKGAK